MNSRLRLALLSVLCAGCAGNIPAEPLAPERLSPPAGGSQMPPAGGQVPTPTVSFQPGPAPLRRLTVLQFRQSVRDLLGVEAVVGNDDIETDSFAHDFSTVGASEISLSVKGIEQFQSTAHRLASKVFADPDQRSALVGCTPRVPSSPGDDGCVRTFITTFGRRVFRRPLSPSDVTRYVTLAGMTAQGDPWRGLEAVTAALLQSPSFLFLTASGEPEPGRSGVRRLTGFELAARLSFALWNSAPDPSLLDAAEKGELDREAGLRGQVMRLLSDRRGAVALQVFFDEHLRLSLLDDLGKDTKLFPQANAALGAAMRREITTMVRDVALSGRDFRDLFDTRQFHPDAALAKIYGVSAAGAVRLPGDGPRAGLLGTAGLLAANAQATITSPTLRGKFVREMVLCQPVPEPPDNVDTTLPPADPGAGRSTMRQRLDDHVALPSCAGCHRLMDPIGLGLENFDAIGAYRTTENGVTIDARAELDGKPFQTAAELGALLREHPAVAECLVRRLYRYLNGRMETSGEDPAVAELSRRFAAGGHDVLALVPDLLSGPWTRLFTP